MTSVPVFGTTANMEPAASVISKAGGLSAIAKACERSEKTVRKWLLPIEKRGTGGLIPSKCQAPILEASDRNGWGIKPEDLVARPSEVAAE